MIVTVLKSYLPTAEIDAMIVTVLKSYLPTAEIDLL